MNVTRLSSKGATAARGFVSVGGIAAIIWAFATIPFFQSDAAPIRIAARIMMGDPYKPEILDAAVLSRRTLYASTRPSTWSKLAIIQQRRVEDAIRSGETSLVAPRLEVLEQTLDQALMNSPSDSFLWLLKYWVQNARDGFALEHFAILRMSYKTGPLEGWIASKRNRLTVQSLSNLPIDLADAARMEFFELVRMEDYSDAADTIALLSQSGRRLFLASLKDLSAAQRNSFAKELFNKNLDDVPVPGAELAPPRPWR